MAAPDITRDQFDELLLIQKKIFQQDRYVMDDELNVIQDIINTRLRRLLSEIVEKGDARFGTGFTVEGDAAANTVVVQGGACAIHVDGHHAVLIWTDSNVVVAGWTTPSGSDRTDYLYLDIFEDTIDSTEDPDLINPARGEETTQDLRLVWSFEKSEGSTPGSAPEGHTYVSIAKIERTDGVAVIATGDITDLLDDHFAYLRQDGSKDLEGNLAVASGVRIDGVDLSEYREVLYRQTLQAAYTHDAEAGVWDSGTGNCFDCMAASATMLCMVRLPHRKNLNINKIRVRLEARCDVTPSNAKEVQVKTVPTTNVATSDEITTTSWGTFYDLVIDISGLNDGDDFVVEYLQGNTGTNDGTSTLFTRKVAIDATYA